MRTKNGFTLIELMLAIAIIGLIASIAMIGQRGAQAKRRDVTRAANVGELQKALTLLAAQAQAYPVYSGCITGADPVTTAIRAFALVGGEVKLADPTYSSDPTRCYFYSSATGSVYTLRYTLESNSSAGEAGDHLVQP